MVAVEENHKRRETDRDQLAQGGLTSWHNRDIRLTGSCYTRNNRVALGNDHVMTGNDNME